MSVGGVSVSLQQDGDSKAEGDLVGFGSFKDTPYGVQLATFVKIMGGKPRNV